MIRLRGIEKSYAMAAETVHALRGVDLDLGENEFIAIMGSSGSGKSTLMNILGCLDRPTRGSYLLDGRDVAEMSAAELARVRNERIGFVFQSFELLPRATALANVELPLVYSRRPGGRRKRARAALEHVGLGDRTDHRPNQLSGGQKQRVAIARAILNDPAIVLADEPTGNLDTTTTRDIMTLFRRLHAHGQTVVIVTHEDDVAAWCGRVIRLTDGRVTYDGPAADDPAVARAMAAGGGAAPRAGDGLLSAATIAGPPAAGEGAGA